MVLVVGEGPAGLAAEGGGLLDGQGQVAEVLGQGHGLGSRVADGEGGEQGDRVVGWQDADPQDVGAGPRPVLVAGGDQDLAVAAARHQLVEGIGRLGVVEDE